MYTHGHTIRRKKDDGTDALNRGHNKIHTAAAVAAAVAAAKE
jgi:hypothetical protein